LEQLEKAREGATVEELRAFLPTWSDEQLRDRVEWLPTCDRTAIVESYRGLNDEDFFPSWSEIDIPVLLIYGRQSPVVPETAVVELRRTNPAAEIEGVSNSGHMIPWDNAREFLAKVSRFIDRITANQLTGTIS
jgi:N-formylmaleamate deformylase